MWRYTPRQAWAFAKLAIAEQRRARALDLTVARVAYYGKPEDVKKLRKALDSDG